MSTALAHEPPAWLSMDEAAEAMRLSRSTLDAMLARAPANLPGAPMLIGAGVARRRRRWDPALIHTWLAAYNAWASRLVVVSAPPPAPLSTTPVDPPRSRPREAPRVAPGPKDRRPSILSEVTRGRRGE